MPPDSLPEPQNASEPEEEEQAIKEGLQRTRKSLIARLDNWQDQKAWDEFYQAYWRLIYGTAIKSGLRQDEAWDVVQETIFSLAKQSLKQMYDPALGTFKSWLLNITRWRINDQFRKRKKDTAMYSRNDGTGDTNQDMLDRVADESTADLERLWDIEWKKNIAKAVLARVKMQVSPKQFQIYDCYVLREWPPQRVIEQLGVSLAQVYLAKHRVGALLKKELLKMQKESELGPQHLDKKD